MTRVGTVKPGDWLDGQWLSEAHGPVVKVGPYRCSPACTRCAGAGCPDRAAWQVVSFRDGTQSTLSGAWPT